jgi:FdhD protein
MPLVRDAHVGAKPAEGASQVQLRRFDIQVYENGAMEPHRFLTTEELALSIRVEGVPFVRVVCSGQHPTCLVTGFLYSCGLIEGIDELRGIDFTEAEAPDQAACETRADVRLSAKASARLRQGAEQAGRLPDATITSAMGWNVPLPTRRMATFTRPDRPGWTPKMILRAARELDECSEIFHLTRSCHNAALFDREGLVYYCLDIGRHNAIDTLVGYMLTNGLDPSLHMIVSSGRTATEIAQKAVRAGIPVFASLSRPMSRAIEIARETGLTLLGNVTPTSMHIYHENGQIVLP